MTTGGAELLRLLGSGSGREVGNGPAAAGAGAGAAFASMLDHARADVLPSGRTVAVAESAGVELSAEQIGRLSAAADRAEAAGAKRAVVLIDGQALQLDVLGREVTAKVDLSAGAVMTGVDAVLAVPGGGAPAAVLPPGAGGLPANPSLLRVLDRLQNDNDRRATA